MKALSVKQPWASEIAKGAKTIETRTWTTDYRGDLLIVSCKSPPIAPAGFALAIVTLEDCRKMTRCDEAAAGCRWYPGAKAWVLRNIRRVHPFPMQGNRGLYDVELPPGALRD